FINYSNNPLDSNSLSSNSVISLAEDHDNKIWVGTAKGLNKLNDDKFQHYLKDLLVKSVFVDATGVIWAGTGTGLYRYDSKTKNFSGYSNSGFGQRNNVLHIMEDNKQNLWVSTSNSIVKISKARDSVKVYDERYGIHHNVFLFSDNLIAPNGELFFGDLHGYYAFFPEQLKDDPISMQLNFTSFKLGSTEIKPGNEAVLRTAVWETKEIELNYKQNDFSFEFAAISYKSAQPPKYMFKLENYDNDWHSIGTDRKAYFFSVPPGKYIFHVRAVNGEGLSAERQMAIVITPPWWKTWWAYTIYILSFIAALWSFIYYRSIALRKKNRVLEEKVAHRTSQLQQSLENLRATQQQLIQQEKMASLGELTAGIAHEIQNPLNFVNNFSEVNTELIDELEQEAGKGNLEEVKAIANDIRENEQKINHHGKRADAIVKGMLQHSRTSSGQKELTDINALVDEYLRLAYHGLRAKDKTFNAKFETDFDNSIEKISIIPQDIGRVLLNLFNNAFYAVSEKQKTADENYKPLVTVATKSPSPLEKGWVEVIVTDNGNGIPKKVVDKIFQPFFTTKPTGEGTGLGLSLSYDIIKAHGGQITVETKEGEGSTFIVHLSNTVLL
ncbi:MAG TPA: ATP-binding protein, partial [Chitinophagaceae bacterium]|nr:ATP-binding protein [Chitinophagaceae bacterium]